jgi:uncharacterized protein YjbI with pentapeptide repeats
MESDTKKKLDKILAEHALWLVSNRKKGKLADLEGWNLDKLNLESADLPFAKLRSVSFRNTYLPGANFAHADLLKVNFSGAILNGTDFLDANLSRGNLAFTDCGEANFTNAILENVNFEGANLEEAIFEGANLKGVNFKNANLSFSDICDADFEGANFEGANLNNTNFEGANLNNTNFEGANLKGVKLLGVKLEPTNFQGVNFEEVKIPDSNLNSTKFIEPGIGNHNIEMPPSNRKTKIKAARRDLTVDSKIVDHGLVEKAVREFFDKVKSDIRFDQVKTICKDQNGIESIDKIDFEYGEIVTHNDQVAFKLNFEISYNLSLLIDQLGNYIISFPEKKSNNFGEKLIEKSHVNGND